MVCSVLSFFTEVNKDLLIVCCGKMCWNIVLDTMLQNKSECSIHGKTKKLFCCGKPSWVFELDTVLQYVVLPTSLSDHVTM